MYAYIQQVIILINNSYCFLFLSIYLHLLKPVEPANAMIHMGDVIPLFEVIQLFHCYLFLTSKLFFEPETVITVKYLVIGIYCYLKILVYKSFMKRQLNRSEINVSFKDMVFLKVIKNRIDTFNL